MIKHTDWFIVIVTGGLGLAACFWLSTVFGHEKKVPTSCSDAVQLCVISEGLMCNRVDELCKERRPIEDVSCNRGLDSPILFQAPVLRSGRVLQLDPIIVTGDPR